MDLFGTLHHQMESVRLPLFAVTVTAAAQVNTHCDTSLARFPACDTAGATRRGDSAKTGSRLDTPARYAVAELRGRRRHAARCRMAIRRMGR